MFLHLIPADNKFDRLIRAQFEDALPGQHVYAYIGSRDGFLPRDGFRHLKDPGDLRDLLQERTDWEGVTVNGMILAASKYVDEIPADLKIAWFLWGHEYYSHWCPFYAKLFGPGTLRAATPWWKHKLRPLVWRLKGRRADFKRVLSRYDFCVCLLRAEFEMLEKEGLTTGMTYIEGAVAALSGFLSDDTLCDENARNIQVGNSASFTNNHIEAFEKLAKLDLSGRKVIVPLSYGSQECREFVLSAGERILGEHFQPLVDFMPLEEYLETVSSCGTVIMNHNRQQALGNIFASLWRGARVYLNDTVVYRGLTQMGFEVNRIDSELGDFSPMPSETVIAHRTLLKKHLGEEELRAKTLNLLNRLRGG